MSTAVVSIPVDTKPLTAKELMKMMVQGQKVEVLKYLRSLPTEESAVLRRKLLHSIDAIQNKKSNHAGSGSESSGSERGNNPSPLSKPHSTSSSSHDVIEETSNRPTSPAPRARNGTTSDVPIQLYVPLETNTCKLKFFKQVHQSSTERANTELAGRYRASEVIGKGGFGTVLKGNAADGGEIVAIKQIDKFMVDASQLPGIMKEAQILQRLNHQNIVKIYGFLETPHTLYFILEYVDSGSLAGMLKKFGVFPENVIASYTYQILQGLKYLHDELIIHRDIKGDNILITKDGKVKLADFGTAKLEDQDKKTQTVVGTPYWMAPEVIEMSACGPTSDVWSLGCTVIELLTGAPPYFELGPMSALFNIVEDRHPPLPENISDELRSFLKLCFKKDPRQRPTASELMAHRFVAESSKQFAGDYEHVSGTLKEHNSGSKKSVVGVFESPVPPLNVKSSGSGNSKEKGSDIRDPIVPKKSSKKTSPTPIPSSSSSSSNTNSSSSKPLSSSSKASTSKSSNSSSTSAATSKKLLSKSEKVKKEISVQQSKIDELQLQLDNDKKTRMKLAGELAKLEAQIIDSSQQNQLAASQIEGLQILLQNLNLKNQTAKRSLSIVKEFQAELGKDVYAKLAYGHLSKQSKCIRPNASVVGNRGLKRRNSS